MANFQDDVLKKLAALRRAYAQQLPAKLGDIEVSWKFLLQGNRDPQTLRAMHRLVHSLNGSGATFGFASLSETARDLEQMLAVLHADESPWDEVTRGLIEKSLMVLRQQVLESEASVHQDELIAAPVYQDDEVDKVHAVYLVDDDNQEAKNIAEQLAHFNYRVERFPDIQSLCDKVPHARPLAIIVDTRHVEKVNSEVLSAVHPKNVPIPMIFLSTQGDFDARLRAVRSGASAYLLKPVDIGSVVDKLDSLVHNPGTEAYRILIVDDEPTLGNYYGLILKHAGMQVKTVDDPRQVMTLLADFNADLIVMNFYMPACNGPDLAAVLRQDETFVSIPIVFLSSETNLARQLIAVGAGADDFLTKPIAPHHLIAAISARARRARILRSLMMHDSLTGVFNHTSIKERLETEISRAQRQDLSLALAMMDIDHFKSVNDRYGHPVGDRVIKTLTRLLRQRLRKTDIIGRYGGEEFLIIMPETEALAAQQTIDSLREHFSVLPIAAQTGELSATFSAGLAIWKKNQSSAELIEAADKALYQAKRSGRNRIVMQ